MTDEIHADSGAHPPSGPWRGFYTYLAVEKRERMDLSLEFQDGRIRGDGTDPHGFFSISGRYQPESGDCTWTKRYPGSHDVFYKGFYEGRGIWGLWEIRSDWRGGFHIWPKGMAEGEVDWAETEAPAEADAVGPQERQAAPAGVER